MPASPVGATTAAYPSVSSVSRSMRPMAGSSSTRRMVGGGASKGTASIQECPPTDPPSGDTEEAGRVPPTIPCVQAAMSTQRKDWLRPPREALVLRWRGRLRAEDGFLPIQQRVFETLAMLRQQIYGECSGQEPGYLGDFIADRRLEAIWR